MDLSKLLSDIPIPSVEETPKPQLSADEVCDLRARAGVSLIEDLTALRLQVSELIGVNRSLLKKLEEQHTYLTTIAKFVRENSSTAPTFGVL